MDAADERAVAWLERFQEKEYAKLGLPLPQVPAVQEILDGLGDTTPFGVDKVTVASKLEGLLLRGDSAPGSRYDDALFRGLLHHIGRDLESCVEPSLNLKSPIFGSSPLSGPNAAVAFHKPSGRHVIIFQRGQFLFFYRAIAALVHICPIRPRLPDAPLEDLQFSQRWAQIEKYHRALPWLLEAVLGVMLGRPSHARVITEAVYGSEGFEYEGARDEYEMAFALHECLAAFVLGH
jgi:hypothetical protein